MGDSMSETVEGSSIKITEIMDFLPHRYPFLLVDRVVEMDGEQSGVGIKMSLPPSRGLPAIFRIIRSFRGF